MQAFRVPSRRPTRCCASLGALLTSGQLCPTIRSVKGAEFRESSCRGRACPTPTWQAGVSVPGVAPSASERSLRKQ